MNFPEAMKHCRSGLDVGRAPWPDDRWLFPSNDGKTVFVRRAEGYTVYVPLGSDRDAKDWEIVAT